MKIVLDTNVLVSGLLQSQGNPSQVLALALAGFVALMAWRAPPWLVVVALAAAGAVAGALSAG